MDIKKSVLQLILSLLLVIGVTATPFVHANYCPSVCSCIGYDGLGGPCYDGLGGAAYDGLGGPAYDGIGGACYDGLGGPCYDGLGGGENCPHICSQCD
jgi:hypothetical protein